MNWLLAALGFTAGLLVNHSHQTLRVANATDIVIAPTETTSIIIPAFNEESYLPQCLDSLYAQNIVQIFPDKFEFIVVVDERTKDNTVDVATARGAKVVYSPPGKLTAKNIGVRESQGEIIVFLDADIYASPNFLNLLMTHFKSPDVVAVSGVGLESGITRIFNVQVNTMAPLLKKLVGFLTAVRKNAWNTIGEYDFTINQFDRGEMLWEEEIDFSRRLQTIGKVIVDSSLSVELIRKVDPCTYGNGSEYCLSYWAAERF